MDTDPAQTAGTRSSYCYPKRQGHTHKTRCVNIYIRAFLCDSCVKLEYMCVYTVARTEFESHHSEELEKWIDELDTELPELTNFILPV